MKIKDKSLIVSLAGKIASPLGLSVYDVEFKQGKNPSLTVFIDKDGGVSLDDCETFHNAIDAPLDELDPTYGFPYVLNVSSPGADRPFKTEKDYLSHVGKKVEVKFYSAVKGKKSSDAVLVSYDGENVVLDDGKETFSVSLKNIVRMNEFIDFN